METYDNGDFLHGEITGLIIAAMYDVHNELGFGFLELVYKNALAVALRELGLRVERTWPMKSTITDFLSAAIPLISWWRRRSMSK